MLSLIYYLIHCLGQLLAGAWAAREFVSDIGQFSVANQFVGINLLLNISQIPGLSEQYLPAQVSLEGAKLYERMLTISYLLIPVFIAVGLVVANFSEQFNVKDLLLRSILVLALIGTLPFTFGATMELGGAISRQIISNTDEQQMRLSIAAEAKEQNQKNQGNEKPTFFSMVGNGLLTALTGNISDLIVALAHTIYLFSGPFISLLWRFLVILAYALAPIMISFLILPNIGNRIFMGWLGGVIQLSFWQVWIAICSWFVNLANSNLELLVSGNLDKIDASNQIEGAAAALLFALLYLATPAAVNRIIPLSTFGSIGSSAVSLGTTLATAAVLYGGKFAGAKQMPQLPGKSKGEESEQN
jgi:hypothetical protein